MAYKRMRTMDIYNIISRWHAGYNISRISEVCDLDRKTVRNYIKLAQQSGLCRTRPLPCREELLEQLEKLIPQKSWPQPGRSVFLPYLDTIISMVTASRDPIKPKTAYEVICERYDITASYSSFKRFVRTHVNERQLHSKKVRQSTCRFETDPGEELQIDYGKVGRIIDSETGKNRDVYAFVGTLSFSRLKFVEFVYKQDQKSFVGSHIKMFAFFGGTAKRLVIDNLKAGVIKADLYDPQLNRAYQEMADHYGCFIDPARPYSPKDKGKVERAVPLVREQFRKLKVQHQHLDIAGANREIRHWCTKVNGMKEHGTTGLKPYEAFVDLEKDKLKSLPDNPFEMATWKQAKVHVDQFIQFEKKFYSVPYKFIGKQVWVRGTRDVIQIYRDYTLIKKHLRNSGKRQTDFSDFPENHRIMMQYQQTQHLIRRAATVGSKFKEFIARVLEPHAMLNYRRALAFLALSEKYPHELLEQAADHAMYLQLKSPKQLRDVIQKLQARQQENPVSISEKTQAMIRDADYFIQ